MPVRIPPLTGLGTALAPLTGPAPTAGVSEGGVQPVPLPQPGLVRLRAVSHPNLGVVAELVGQVNPSGYGEIEVTDRDGQVSLSRPRGRPPLSLPLPLLLDRWSERSSVEAEITALERMAGLDPNMPLNPALIVEGVGVPHSYTRNAELRWMISGDLEWGETRNVNGSRAYAEITVTLVQLVLPAMVDEESSTDRRVTFVVPAGAMLRTLAQIAKAHSRAWRQLRTLNPRLPSDPDKRLVPGTRVRIH